MSVAVATMNNGTSRTLARAQFYSPLCKCYNKGLTSSISRLKQNNNPNLGDLINLNGLKKPADSVMKVSLWGKAEKVKELGEGMSDLAGKVEDHHNVQAGDVAGLVEVMRKALVKELSPENAAKLLKLLKTRFEEKRKPYKSAEGVKWEDVQRKLESSPEKLWSLQQMEDTGGEPDLIEYDKKNGEYIFMDCSAESPASRRNCVYDREAEEYLRKNHPTEIWHGNTISMAALMGVDILNEKEYRELQTKGEFDKNSWSWIKTPVDKRKAGVALYGARRDDEVDVGGHGAYFRNGYGSFRVSLRVK